MKIELHEITVREVFNGYRNSEENGVVGYHGLLNIRPKYQREFVYGEKEQRAVIDTIQKGFPLNVMYWAQNEDGSFELLDGQQRTVSFCSFLNSEFSVNGHYFHGLTETEQNRILDYKLLVYWCIGNDEERLAWFRIINIAGLKLTDQELRNANYTGEWLTSAKSFFSKTNAPGALLSKGYVKAEVNRQELLEVALKWVAHREEKTIEEYMAERQCEKNADDLWLHFRDVIDWAKRNFKVYRKEMCTVDWGALYDRFRVRDIDPDDIEYKINLMMGDPEVENKKGIYYYVLTYDEKYLNLRQFSDDVKRQKYEEQGGICPHCVREGREIRHYLIEEMEADHIRPWVRGGKTVPENCQLLCREHNRLKGAK